MKTIKLSAQERWVCRSQAKRILSHVEGDTELDFAGINEIGQAFADEVFRVFKSNNPDVRLVEANVVADVANMIQHVKSSP